ncbi:MAG: hypothetical protein ACYC27_22525 [Armatimonadota bacterium]
MYQSALPILLKCLESMPSASFTQSDICHWKSEEVQALIESGILREGQFAESVDCNGCDECCHTDVEVINKNNGTLIRAFVYCIQHEDIGRVPVPIEHLKIWNASHNNMVDFLRDMFGIDSQPQEHIKGRLWWLGSLKSNGKRSDLFMARGATWPDAQDIFSDCSHIAGCSRPLVLVLTDMPGGKLFGVSARVAPLSRLLTIDGSSLFIDIDETRELLELPRIVSTIPIDIFEPLSNDYRFIKYRGSILKRLSITQAVIIRLLHDEYEHGNVEVPFKALRFPEDINPPGKVTDIFRPDDESGRNILIVEVDKGVYKLNI